MVVISVHSAPLLKPPELNAPVLTLPVCIAAGAGVAGAEPAGVDGARVDAAGVEAAHKRLPVLQEPASSRVDQPALAVLISHTGAVIARAEQPEVPGPGVEETDVAGA